MLACAGQNVELLRTMRLGVSEWTLIITSPSEATLLLYTLHSFIP